MDPSLDILKRLGNDNPNPPSNEELESAAADLRSALDAATTAEVPNLDLAKALREGLDQVNKEQAERTAAVEAARAEAAKLRDGIFDPAPEADPAPEEDPAPEADPANEADKEPVAASSVDSILDRIRKFGAASAPKAEEKPKSVGGVRIKGVGPAAGYDLGEGTFADLGQMFATHGKSVSGPGRADRLFRLTRDYDPSRHLGFNVEQNNRRITDVFGYGPTTRPQTAAGGLCGPGDVDFSHPVCSDTGRPVRDSLVQFNAARGSVTFSPAMSIADMDGATSIWTPEMDAAAPASGTKPCPHLECPEELSASVDAVTRCLTVGNFQATFSPEFWASSLEVLMAAHDRTAEQKMLVEIHEASTFLSGASIIAGTNVIENFLSNLNGIIASDRAIQRRTSGQYHVITDSFVRDALRNQVIANLGVANNIETIQLADSIINGWLSEIGVRVTWTYDGTVNEADGTHRVPTAVGGPIPDATVYVHPEDAFMFLDGGTLDLGTQITDSSLNATNDRQAFAETFEKVAFRGCSAYAFTLDTVTNCGCA